MHFSIKAPLMCVAITLSSNAHAQTIDLGSFNVVDTYTADILSIKTRPASAATGNMYFGTFTTSNYASRIIESSVNAASPSNASGRMQYKIGSTSYDCDSGWKLFVSGGVS